MIRAIKKTAFVLFSLLPCLFFSCTQTDSGSDAPLIELKSGDSLTNDSDVVKEGYPIRFHIRATAGSTRLTNLQVCRTTSLGTEEMLNIGMYCYDFDSVLTYAKTSGVYEYWTFFIQDHNRKRSQISRTVLLFTGIHYGEIYYYPNITLYAQDLADSAHYLACISGTRYVNPQQADQARTDLAFIYNNQSCSGIPTISCPADASIGLFYPAVNSWLKKNITLFDSRQPNGITDAGFNAANNDSLLTISYDSNYGIPKYEWPAPNTYIPFKTANGKNGIMHIISVGSSTTSAITLSIKIQK